MVLNTLRCCAYQEIASLSIHPNGKDAMLEFCRMNFGSSGANYNGLIAQKSTLYSFYLFSAPVNDGVSRPYGDNFAKFIKENKLGEVLETPAMTNWAFHSDHKNKVWVWMPDHAAVAAWWQDNRPTPKRTRKPAFVFAPDETVAPPDEIPF